MSDSVSSGPDSEFFDSDSDVPGYEIFPPEWYDDLPKQWDPQWIIQHDDDVRSREDIPPLLFRSWSKGSGGRVQEPGNNPTRLIPPGFLDPHVPRRPPHTFLTPKQFIQMVIYHFQANGNIRESTGYDTLFMSYTPSPAFAWEYAHNLAIAKPEWTPEDAKDAHISMIDTSRLGPDTIVYHIPRLAQLFQSISAKCKNKLMMLENCHYEYLVFGIVDAYGWPGSLSSLPYSRMVQVDESRLDGMSDRYRRHLSTLTALPDLRELRETQVRPLTQDLFPILFRLVDPMPRLGVLSACWMLALLSMARRSEHLLIEVASSRVPTDLLISIASECQLNSHDLDELIDGYERIRDIMIHDDCLQLHRLARKLRDVLRLREQKPSLPSSFFV